MLAMIDVCNFPEQFGLKFGRRFCISFFLSLLASMVSRASCKMDLSMCENLLKAHVDSVDQQQYMKVDLDEVVEEFEGFLMAAYAMVDRMNVSLIEKAAKEIFGVQHAQACAQRLAAAFSHLRKKEASMTTGAKLHPAVKRIIVAKQKQQSMSGTPKGQVSPHGCKVPCKGVGSPPEGLKEFPVLPCSPVKRVCLRVHLHCFSLMHPPHRAAVQWKSTPSMAFHPKSPSRPINLLFKMNVLCALPRKCAALKRHSRTKVRRCWTWTPRLS